MGVLIRTVLCVLLLATTASFVRTAYAADTCPNKVIDNTKSTSNIVDSKGEIAVACKNGRKYTVDSKPTSSMCAPVIVTIDWQPGVNKDTPESVLNDGNHLPQMILATLDPEKPINGYTECKDGQSLGSAFNDPSSRTKVMGEQMSYLAGTKGINEAVGLQSIESGKLFTPKLFDAFADSGEQIVASGPQEAQTTTNSPHTSGGTPSAADELRALRQPDTVAQEEAQPPSATAQLAFLNTHGGLSGTLPEDRGLVTPVDDSVNKQLNTPISGFSSNERLVDANTPKDDLSPSGSFRYIGNETPEEHTWRLLDYWVLPAVDATKQFVADVWDGLSTMSFGFPENIAHDSAVESQTEIGGSGSSVIDTSQIRTIVELQPSNQPNSSGGVGAAPQPQETDVSPPERRPADLVPESTAASSLPSRAQHATTLSDYFDAVKKELPTVPQRIEEFGPTCGITQANYTGRTVTQNDNLLRCLQQNGLY